MRYTYIVVEGPHDIEVVGRILKPKGFSKVRNLDQLDEYWHDIIPRSYPPDGDLLKRVPIPAFFQKEGCSLAVHSAGGLKNIPKVLNLTLLNLLSREKDLLSGVGVIVDADNRTAELCFKDIVRSLGDDNLRFSELSRPGEIVETSHRMGIHIFPNNNDPGTLEDALLECASIIYPDLLARAKAYIDSIEDQYKKGWGMTDGAKVLVGCMANVFRPGKANQVSIEDNEWISEATKDSQSVKAIKSFIEQLMLI